LAASYKLPLIVKGFQTCPFPLTKEEEKEEEEEQKEEEEEEPFHSFYFVLDVEETKEKNKRYAFSIIDNFTENKKGYKKKIPNISDFFCRYVLIPKKTKKQLPSLVFEKTTYYPAQHPPLFNKSFKNHRVQKKE